MADQHSRPSFDDVSLLDFSTNAYSSAQQYLPQTAPDNVSLHMRSQSSMRSISSIPSSVTKDIATLDTPHNSNKALPSLVVQKRSSVPQRKNKRTRSLLLTLGWWWELGSILLAIICTSLTVAILWSMNGRALNKWPLDIQPNSLVAAFSTVAKSALLCPLAECLGQLKWAYFERPRTLDQFQAFDAASRGPWGATIMLWRTKGKARLASLGAIITVIMLAFEPFTQQVIGFPIRIAPLENQMGSISTTHAWSDHLYDISDDMMGPLDYSSFLSQVALLSAAADQPYTGTSINYCPAAECRVDDYDTLAICAKCEESPIQNDDFDVCTYRIGGGGDSDAQKGIFENFADFSDAVRTLPEFSRGSYSVHCTKQFEGFPPLTIQASVPSMNQSYIVHAEGREMAMQYRVDEDETIAGLPRFLHSCNNASVADPVPEDTDNYVHWYVDSPTLLSKHTCFNSTTYLRRYDDPTHTLQINGSVTRCRLDFCARRCHKASFQNSTLQVSSTTNIPLKIETRAGSTENPINMDNVLTADGVENRFHVGLLTRTLMNKRMLATIDSDSFWNNLNIDIPRSSPSSLPGNWTHRFHSIADAFSTIIQHLNNPNSTKVPMVAYGEEVYVEVRWQWFLLPLGLVLLSILLLSITMFESRNKEYLFKTSVLAVLFHGLEDWDMLDSQVGLGKERVTFDEMIARSKTMTVRLGEGEKGGLKLKVA